MRRPLLRAAAAACLVGTECAVFAAQAAQPDAEIPQSAPAGTDEPATPATSLLGRAGGGLTALPSPASQVTVERSQLLPPSGAWPGAGAVDAYGRPFTEVGGLTYRWWLGNGRSRLGFGLGTLGYVVAPPQAQGPLTLAYPASTFTVGWRHALGDRSVVYADASGARRVGSEATANLYSTKVGVEWKSARSPIGFERGALGIQFDSGLRLSLRARRGGLAMYVRSTF